MIHKEIICFIDIGTTKIVSVIAECEKNSFKIIGLGKSKSEGLKKGVIVDVQKTVSSIKDSIEIATKQAKVDIDSAFVGISGQHVSGINYSGVISIGSQNDVNIGDEISEDDVERVKNQARSIHLSADRKILHVLNQEYVIDDKEGMNNPIGLSGNTLKSKVHLVTIDNNAERDLRNSLEKANIEVNRFILEPLASGYSVLDDHEMKLGKIVIDIGGGTTDMIVFKDEGVLHTVAIPYGGNSISTDLAYFLNCSIEEAERIKIEYGAAKSILVDDTQLVEYITTQNESTNNELLKKIANVIEMRMSEIFFLLKKELERINYDKVHSLGIVLTGGGAKLKNIVDLSEEIFELRARIGTPQQLDGLGDKLNSPRYSTLIGLIKYYNRHPNESSIENNDMVKKGISKIKDFIKKLY